MRILTAAMLVTIVLFSTTAWHIWQSYQDYRKGPSQEYQFQFLLSSLNAGIEMTSVIRQMVNDRSLEQLADYERAAREVENVLRDFARITPDEEIRAVARQIDATNRQLVAMELRTLDLARRAEWEQARNIVYGEEYRRLIRRFDAYNRLLDRDMREIVGQRIRLLKRRAVFGIAAIAISLPILVFVWVFVLGLVRRHMTERIAHERLNVLLANLEQKLSAVSTPAETGRVIFETADELFGWESCFLCTTDSECHTLRHVVAMDVVNGERAEVLPPQPQWPLSPMARKVIREGAQLVQRDPAASPAEEGICFGEATRASACCMVVPFKKGEAVIGLLSIQSYRENAYTPKDLALLKFLVEHSGAALDRTLTEARLRDSEEELRKAHLQEQLIHTDKMVSLGILVSGVAHEINNPNNFIMLNAPMLLEAWKSVRPILDRYHEENGDFLVAGLSYPEMAENMPTLVSGILDGSKRIRNIVQELRDFSRQDAGFFQDKICVNAVVQSALTLLASMIGKSTNHFSSDFAQDIPPLRGNFQRLEQVVINLIQNACQALPDKERALSVATSYDARSGVVLIRVVDQGVGIPEEMLKRVMDPFFTTKRGSAGIGLGLSISLNIIQQHGGTLELRSRPGMGTVATVSLPRLSHECGVTDELLAKNHA